ncbi:MAG: hypothetical protein HON82_03905 [Candidatus Marinimicrobia bacterium]|jgi:hypothetical protein|nr:hypothetical protein [Candidatus Neomarinimicrobiota bacterium]
MATVNLKFNNYGIIKNINDDQVASVNQFREKYDLTDNKMSAVFQLKDNQFILWHKINVGCCDKGSGFGTQAISTRGNNEDYYALSFLNEDVNEKRSYWSFGSVDDLSDDVIFYYDFYNLCCEIFDDFNDSDQYTLSIYIECESLLNEYDHFDVSLRDVEIHGLLFSPGYR